MGVLVCVALAIGATAWAGTKQVVGPENAFTLAVPEDWKVEKLGNGLELRPADHAFQVFLHANPRHCQTLQEQAKAYAESNQQLARELGTDKMRWRQESLQPIRLGGIEALLLRATVASPFDVQREDNYLALTAKHQVRIKFVGRADRLDAARDAIQALLATLRFPGRAAPAPQPFPTPVPPPPGPGPAPGPTPGAMKQVQDPSGAFVFSVPGDWRVQQQAGTMMACDATGQAFAQVLAAPKQFQSLDQFAQAAIAMWRQQVPQWQAVGQQAVQVAGRPALQIRATGSPNNAAMMADYFLVLGDRCQAIVTVFCPQAAFPQRQAVFQQIIQTLQVR